MLGPGFHTSDTIWEVTELPGRLLVLGGGSVGCELGQAFARLGSTVTIVETAPRLLPSEDPDASELLASALRADGIDIRTGIGVTRFADSIAELADGSRVEFDVALLAIGRTPRTVGLGLTEAGVDVDARGHVIVDRHLRTSNPRVWAAGDVTTYPQFTHCAGVYASTAASNAVLGLRRSVDPDRIPRVTFTQPEIAAVGIGVEQARRERLTIRHVDHRHVDRAVAEQRTAGFSRLILDCKGRVAGATLVGPRAGEALAEVALAIAEGLRVRDLAASMHAYPTYADGVWNAAIGEVQAGLARPSMRTVTALLGTSRAARSDEEGHRPRRRAVGAQHDISRRRRRHDADGGASEVIPKANRGQSADVVHLRTRPATCSPAGRRRRLVIASGYTAIFTATWPAATAAPSRHRRRPHGCFP